MNTSKIIKRKWWQLACLSFIICQLSVSPAGAQSFTIDSISDGVFARMQGKSFPDNCTIPREDLRYLQVLHYDVEGEVHTGELVCNKAIAQDLIDIFRQLYEARYPIEKIRLIDDYDADDERSMADNNTSCFCFRVVAGTTHLSKHARGMAIDINTRYNPYVRYKKGKQLVSPENGVPYADRRKASPYKVEEGDLCHRLFKEHGFFWGGNWRTVKDYQHFEK